MLFYPNKIDIVIMDMIMPEMGGEERYDKLKKIHPKVKFFYYNFQISLQTKGPIFLFPAMKL